MTEDACCFSGHRKIDEGRLVSLQAVLYDAVNSLIQKQIRSFLCGGALGFDMLAAQTVLQWKKSYEDVRLVLVFPCKEQDKYWIEQDKKIYETIQRQADEIIYTSEQYYRGCMKNRNRFLVEHSRHCICYQRDENGGTAFTVEYARKKGLQVINLADNL